MKNYNSKLKNFTFCIAIFSFALFIFHFSLIYASETNGTITSGGNNGYAWSNQTGWVNFGATNGNIQITDAGITGYAWNNNYGWINMKPTNGGVVVAANGALSGYAWSSGLGWINFSGVSINSSGKFVGIASGTNIGTLTFDCTNCSVATDFRPQSFRTVAPAPTTIVSSGGGGGVGMPYVSGPSGQPVPAHISAFNVPMKLYPAQSGILTQGLTNQKSVVLDVPNNVYSDDITFIIKEEVIFSDIVSPNVSVVGNVSFDVSARDRVNRSVHSFLKPVKITLNIPELLRGRSDLGVYFFDPVRSRPAEGSATSALGRSASNGVDETSQAWVKIPDAVFSGDSVSFSVSHLTLFAIFAGTELSPTIEAPFQLFPQFEFEIPRSKITTLSERIKALIEETPAEKATTTKITSEENLPLFDIEVSPGPSLARRSLGAGGESKRTRVFILTVLIIAAAGTAFYILKRIRKN